MNITREEKKIEAIKLMSKLGIYEPYITGFNKENMICFYENHAGYWVYQNEELANKIKEFEEEYNCLVFAVTHEYTEFGELYDFIYVSDYEEDWQYTIEEIKNNKDKFYVNAYVWNISDDYCSEFGTILVDANYGGLKRIG